MKARARVHGAITIVNAIPAGIGAALGIDLWTEAEAVATGDGRIEAEIEGEAAGETALAEAAARIILREMRSKRGIRLKIRSNIPVGRGLKSSSAAADAIVLAAAGALGLGLDLERAVQLAVDASIEAGVTVTGAYDDAYTCMMGGVNVTDNHQRRLLMHRDADTDLRILILVPEERIYTREVDVGALRRVGGLAKLAAELALMGRFWEAMTLNGLAVASALNLDPAPILAALRAGALASGVSGTGPAIAAVTTESSEDEVTEALESFGPVIRARPNNDAARVEWLG